MIKIELNETANQTFGASALGINYNISLRIIDGIMYASVWDDDVILCSSVRCIPNQVIIPYPHLTKGGNFYWYCQDNDYPDWQKFNGLHQLLFLTDAELTANVI
jgi:hypothetical protein